MSEQHCLDCGAYFEGYEDDQCPECGSFRTEQMEEKE
jgi:DNA-directed RNA polymerase subunit RPC12/RpoP